MSANERYCEINYEQFVVAKDNERGVLYHVWSSIREQLNIKTHRQILYLMSVSRQGYIFRAEQLMKLPKYSKRKVIEGDLYSIRVLDDKKTLMFSSLQLKLQIRVCWKNGCDGASGEKFSLTCNKHDDNVTHFISSLKEQVLNIPNNSCSDFMHLTAGTTYYRLNSMANDELVQAQKVEQVVNVFVSMFGAKCNMFDITSGFNVPLRKFCAELLATSTFIYRNLRLGYDSSMECFLFKDMNEKNPSWKPICKHKKCVFFVVSGYKMCSHHFRPRKIIDPAEDQDVAHKLAVYLGVESLEELNVDLEDILIKKIGRKKYVLLGEGLTVRVDQISILFQKRGKKWRYCSSPSCKKLYRVYSLVEGCRHCSQNTYLVVILSKPCTDPPSYLISSQPISTIFHRINDVGYEGLKEMLVSDVVRIKNLDKKTRNMGGVSGWKLIYLYFCKTFEYAEELKCSLPIYLYIESELMGKPIKVAPIQMELTDCYWKIIRQLCQDRNLRINIVDKSGSALKPKNFELTRVEAEYESSDSGFTIYKIQVDNHIYIGLLNKTVNRSGLPIALCHFLKRNKTKSVELLNLLRRKGIAITVEAILNVSETLAIVTNPEHNPYSVESLLILAFKFSEELLNGNLVVVNQKINCVRFNSGWIGNLQFVLESIFGMSFEFEFDNDFCKDNLMIYSKDCNILDFEYNSV